MWGLFRKKLSVGWVVALSVFGFVFNVLIGPVVGLNIENWATENKIGDELIDGGQQIMPLIKLWILEIYRWLETIMAFAISDLFVGFVIGSIVFGLWDFWSSVLSKPRKWSRGLLARRKTGLVPVRILKLPTKHLFENNNPANLSHPIGTIVGFENTLASVLVQSGAAEYYQFWDEWLHSKYQKLARSKQYTTRPL